MSCDAAQATHMSAERVDEEAVYMCTGNPMPKDIQAIVQALFNEDFVDVFAKILDMQMNKGLAVTDIVQQLHPCAASLTPFPLCTGLSRCILCSK